MGRRRQYKTGELCLPLLQKLDDAATEHWCQNWRSLIIFNLFGCGILSNHGVCQGGEADTECLWALVPEQRHQQRGRGGGGAGPRCCCGWCCCCWCSCGECCSCCCCRCRCSVAGFCIFKCCQILCFCGIIYFCCFWSIFRMLFKFYIKLYHKLKVLVQGGRLSIVRHLNYKCAKNFFRFKNLIILNFYICKLSTTFLSCWMSDLVLDTLCFTVTIQKFWNTVFIKNNFLLSIYNNLNAIKEQHFNIFPKF